MKNKGIILAILGILVLFCRFSQPVYAGVGNTESGGSATIGGGGEDYSSFGDSFSDFSSDSSFGTRTRTSRGYGDLFVLGVAFLMFLRDSFKQKGNNGKVEPENNEKAMKAIKLLYPNFDEDDFISYTKELYLTLQNAWMEKDWERVRHLETKSLFRQHNMQLQEYIDNHTTNHLDRVCVDRAIIKSFKRSDDQDMIKVILSSYMCDYIRNDDTGELIQGDPIKHLYTVYNMEFIYEEDDAFDSTSYQRWKLNTYEVVDENEFYFHLSSQVQQMVRHTKTLFSKLFGNFFAG